MSRRRVRLVLALAAVALATVAAGAADRARPGDGRVLVARLEGVVSPVTAEIVAGAIERADRDGYAALVLEVDTPGGLETSMRAMVRGVLASPVPVITWVTPAGGRAASAGVFVVMAGDVAAMAPGTNIGAATPVQMGGAMDSTLARKAANDAAAFARTVAAQRGRNRVWAEEAVRHAVSASDSEAVALGIVDLQARSLEELLSRADGRSWRRGDAVRELAVAGRPVDRVRLGFRETLLALIADPNVAYLLMILGFYGLLFELQSPGAILPGVVGGICLILAFLALSALPVNAAGVALLVLSLVFFLAEIKVASHGVLGAGGVLSLLLGSIVLFHGEGVRLSWTVIVAATVTTALFFAFVIGAGLRAQRRPATTGAAGMAQRRGTVVDRLAPDGMVRVEGELWRARADRAIETGEMVEVTGVEGLTLRVRALTTEGGP